MPTTAETTNNMVHTPPKFCKENIDAYLLQTGWVAMPQTMIPAALVYYHQVKNIGLVFMDDTISIRECPANAQVNAVQIMMNWEAPKYFKGWDGRNEFMMMMVLHFIDAVKMHEVSKAVKLRINMEHLLAYIPDTYGMKAEKVLQEQTA